MTPFELRFYLDENIDSAIAKGMRLRQIDVLTTPEADNMGKDDEQQLAFALEEKPVVVTQDADFLRLHNEGVPHAGIAYYKQGERSIKQILRRLFVLHSDLSIEEMQNHVEYL